MRSTTTRGPEGGPFTPEELEALGMTCDDIPGFECPYCGRPRRAKAYVLFGKAAWFPAAPCGCEESRRAASEEAGDRRRAEAASRARSLERAGIAPRYQGSVLHDERCARFLAAFDDNPGRGLYIYGACGSGKTSLACAVARDLFDAGKSVLFTTSIDMLEAIQETFNTNASSARAMRRFTDCDLLVVDDMGKESASDWAVSTIYQVINRRYGAMRSTVLTSEYRLSQLGERMARRGFGDSADAILSRLKETCELVRLPDIDYRLSKDGFPVGGGPR